MAGPGLRWIVRWGGLHRPVIPHARPVPVGRVRIGTLSKVEKSSQTQVESNARGHGHPGAHGRSFVGASGSGNAARSSRSDRAWVFVAVVASVYAALPLVTTVLLTRTDDGEEFLLRAFTLDRALAAHAMYPRWLPDVYLGFGYPVFAFYAPVAYLLVAALTHLGAGTVDVAARVVAAGIVVVAGLGAATLAGAMVPEMDTRRSRGRDIAVGVVAAVAYVGSPYPFVTNILLRGDLPEAMALAILPWFWLAVRHLLRSDAPFALKPVVIAGMLGALTILVHQLSAVMAAAAMTLVMVGHVGRGWSRGVITRVVTAGAIAVGVTAILWIPLAVESSSVRLDVVSHGVPEVVARLSPLWMPVMPVWPYPHGWEPSRLRAPDGPVLPGITQTVIVTAAALVGVMTVWRRRVSGPMWGGGRGDVFGVALVVVTCWLLNLEPSAGIWSAFVPLRVVQFPWRWLGPLSLGVALLGALAVSRMRVRIAISAAVVVGALSWGDSLGALPRPVAPDDTDRYDAAAMVADDYAFDRWGASTTTGDGEFTPRAVDIRRPDGSLGGVVRLDRVAPPGAWMGGLAMVQAGEGYVSSLHGDATRLRAVVVAGDAGATLAIHQLDFPGWRATVDGVRVDIRAATEVPGSGVTPGWLTVAVPAGRHEVAVWFGATWPRLLGDAVTCVTLALVGRALVREWRRGALRLVGTTLVVAGLLVVATWNLGSEALTIGAPAAASPATERVVLDVVEAVRRGDASLGSPSGARLGLDAFLDIGWLDVRPPSGRPVQVGTGRRWLYMHPPGRVSVRLTPPQGAVFQAGLALRPDSWETPEGDGVHFVVEVVPVDGPGGMRTLLFQRINPRAFVDERRWVDIRADLGEWAGRPIDLTLRTDPVDSVAYDWAGWGNPVVVVPVGVLRPPNGPQPPASIHAPRTWMIDQ